MSKRTYATQVPGAAAVTPTDDGPAPIVGADTEAVLTIAGREVPLAEIVIGAFETSGLSVEEWNAAEPQMRDDLVGKKRKEVEQTLASAGELPSQEAARKAAVAAVNARRASRAAIDEGTTQATAQASRKLPHCDEIDPMAIAAPVLTQQGWIVPSAPRELPRSFK
ncbi:hypothetical protein K6W16_10425 [Burkholderia dolosa]|uniref:Uncharacterized protein n=1 Tax=Burkholderia dolosa TaxID=152500 RepID=A0A892IAF5_9BURK|nr:MULTISPECIES: hypothetical protein [Burkholderia]AKE03033.1 hypothetical protein XM57_08810 [Burkholderia cepacia]AJY14475.1 hypothetical protein AK34_719 [Burkholderia dolosa AU0158]AYZ97786.1 hypothetical protein EGY28_22765 [Burkholderia dolosa]ETP66800.1 hypothetical protein BDSB_05465 [Burkholderia dolosa PC543]MBR8419811.1 hypothetical protein [Burkholderia dolosa]